MNIKKIKLKIKNSYVYISYIKTTKLHYFRLNNIAFFKNIFLSEKNVEKRIIMFIFKGICVIFKAVD